MQLLPIRSRLALKAWSRSCEQPESKLPKICSLAGIQTGDLMGNAGAFSSIYVWTEAWQHVGWDSIMYIAALSAIDPQLYEAAEVDGANKWQKILTIDIPMLVPTMVTLFILRCGSLLGVGFEKVYLLKHTLHPRYL